jgi:hypothetical protein
MALLSPVVYLAIVRAQEARIAAEVTSLDGAMKAFKEKYGMYPPSDFSAVSSPTGPVALFLGKAFPNCSVSNEIQWITNNSGGSVSPAQALVFWLQGFSPDTEHPLSGLANAPSTPFFPFDQSRLVNTWATSNPTIFQRFAVYAPANGQNAPYVYCAGQNYTTQPAFPGTWTSQGGTGTCKPYLQDGATYANPNSFQIISAGLDGNYGSGGGSYPSGTNYAAGDLDNITNFSNGTNLQNDVPVNQ